MEGIEEWLLPLDVSPGEAELGELAEQRVERVIGAFRPQRELLRTWHWFAVASSISHLRLPAAQSQCQIASAELRTQCCVQQPPQQCDQSGWVSEAMETAGVLEADIGGRAPFALVRAEVFFGKAVGVGIAWQNNQGEHSVSVYGYAVYRPNEAANMELLVGDPWPVMGVSWVYYERFPMQYAGGGVWSETGYPV